MLRSQNELQEDERSPGTEVRSIGPSRRFRGRILLTAALIGLAVACYQFRRSGSSTAHQTETTGTIVWHTDLPGALAQSKKTGKAVLVDFSATWCPPCQEMKRDVWTDPAVGQAVNAQYLPVLMDADSRESQGPSERYQVATIPRILILDGDGNILRDGSTMTRDEVLDFLRRQ